MTALVGLIGLIVMTVAGVAVGARQAFYALRSNARVGRFERDALVLGVVDDALDEEALEVRL